MLFNSFQFLVFFPVVTAIYFLLPHRFRWLHLLISSCVFYAAFIPVYLLILFSVIIVDYIAGIYIEKAVGKLKRIFLIVSIISNVSILAVFKYYDFFIDNINILLESLGLAVHTLPYWSLILPIGLSFHTFQAMSYTIEVYRGNQKAERHFGIYALYVMFYPQLVAGPIERPQNMLHQFHEKKKMNGQLIYNGFAQMVWGFFKKIVVADSCAVLVNQIWTDYDSLNGSVLIIGAILFSFQIYCDFSGYSDIALGSAKMMGFNLMTNFRYPYFAQNIRDFWKRWHISLSTWFRDYVFFPLGGSRGSLRESIFNVLVVFVLSGFWHGASWTFVIWGMLHALFFLPLYIFKASDRPTLTGSFRNWINISITFVLVTFSWIFFRSTSIQESISFIRGCMQLGNPADFFLKSNVYLLTTAIIIAVIIQLLVIEWKNRFYDTVKFTRDWPLVILIVEIVFLGYYKNPLSFIYFQF